MNFNCYWNAPGLCDLETMVGFMVSPGRTTSVQMKSIYLFFSNNIFILYVFPNSQKSTFIFRLVLFLCSFKTDCPTKSINDLRD